MQVSHGPAAIPAAFDDTNLIAHCRAGPGNAPRRAVRAPKADAGAAAEPEVNGADGTTGQASNTELAETGGDSSTPYIAIAGAAVLSIGATAVFALGRRRSAAGGR
ncbi:LAETG motif-containing sortase-dependent surface protein [Streptomyces sp. NPDC059218]|uniref:LAETG motif-containing sortase-dependent surface protein n=1 Tax=unclassified Streptomyces TaxID=2593676 RepID=UPI0036961E7A